MMAGWLMGQLQFRLQLVALSAVSFLIGVTRVTVALLPIGVPDTLGKFVAANLASGLVGIWFLTWKLWPAEEAVQVRHDQKGGMWKNALLLSAAGSLIPQFDMFLMNHTQASGDFIAFARASLIGRVVYAITVIVAQWLLPRQIRGEQPLFNITPWHCVIAVFGFCGAVAWGSPFIAESILHWDTTPSRTLVFLASAEISMLGLVFMVIQTACARHNLRRASLMLGLLGVEAVAQLVVKLPMTDFLVVALTLQTLAVLIFSVKE